MGLVGGGGGGGFGFWGVGQKTGNHLAIRELIWDF
jgi:hypothetical protein